MKRNGFTLVELMIALSIMGVLLSVALPGMAAMVERQRLRMAVFDLLGAVELARSQALARGTQVLLAPREAAGLDWASGWVVFVDRDGDRRPGLGDDIVSVHGPVARGIHIAAVFSSQQHPDYIAYNGSGRSANAGGGMAARWGTLTLVQGADSRRIRINMLGRARACDPGKDGSSCEGGSDTP
jgi:type IV fimbrial biogenesis protein FimT